MIDARALLIIGPSGGGKSDLALRLLDRGAALIADDMVHVTVDTGRLVALPAQRQPAQIELRGIGIMAWHDCATHPIPLSLVIDVGGPQTGTTTKRGADPGRFGPIWGYYLPQIMIDPAGPSAPIKAEVALRRWGL